MRLYKPAAVAALAPATLLALVGAAHGQSGIAEDATLQPRDGAGRFLERVEREVVEGDLPALEELRSEASKRLVAAPPGSTEETIRARYELAYLHWRVSQVLDRKSGKQRKKLLEEAEVLLDLLLAEAPQHAEAHALRGSVIGDRIGGFLSGMMLGRKASAALATAAELAPDNPRVAVQQGVGFFFTPKTFGGGMERAEETLRRARTRFAEGTAADEWPYWGHVDALGWLGQVLAKTNRPEEARQLYLEALDLEPGHSWVRDELLPALDK